LTFLEYPVFKNSAKNVVYGSKIFKRNLKSINKIQGKI
jgi:hypothetical protein